MTVVAQSVHPDFAALVLEPAYEVVGYVVPQRHEVPGRPKAQLPLGSPQYLDVVPASGGLDVVGEDEGRLLAVGPWRGGAPARLRAPRRAPTASRRSRGRCAPRANPGSRAAHGERRTPASAESAPGAAAGVASRSSPSPSSRGLCWPTASGRARVYPLRPQVGHRLPRIEGQEDVAAVITPHPRHDMVAGVPKSATSAVSGTPSGHVTGQTVAGALGDRQE